GRRGAGAAAEARVGGYPAGQEPDPARVAGVDLGIIHPYAVAGPGGEGLLVSGRAIRAEHRMHLADRKARARAVARRAPKPGQKGSRRGRHYRRRQRLARGRPPRGWRPGPNSTTPNPPPPADCAVGSAPTTHATDAG